MPGSRDTVYHQPGLQRGRARTKHGRKFIWASSTNLAGCQGARTVIKKGKNHKSTFKSAELSSGGERESACGWQISATTWHRLLTWPLPVIGHIEAASVGQRLLALASVSPGQGRGNNSSHFLESYPPCCTSSVAASYWDCQLHTLELASKTNRAFCCSESPGFPTALKTVPRLPTWTFKTPCDGAAFPTG